MSLKNGSIFARRELRAALSSGIRGFRVFFLCLVIGVAAIAAIGSVRSSIEAGLQTNGARLLGGHAELEFTYRFANEAEADWIATQSTAHSEIVEFRSMLVFGQGDSAVRGLTQVKGVDGAYPLLGGVALDPALPLTQALAGKHGLPGIVMERVLADRLGAAKGDVLRLGTQEFILTALILSEPDGTPSFALGPRSIVRTEDLAASGLIQTGTLFSSKYRMLLPNGVATDALNADFETAFPNAGARWRDASNGAPGISEFVDRLGTFLILVGLSGLAVGGVGIASAVRAYVADKRGFIATLKTLGASRGTIFWTFILQILAIATAAVLLGVVLGTLIPLILGPIIQARIPVPMEFGLHARAMGEALVYGYLVALLFSVWPLANADRLRPAALYRDDTIHGMELPTARYVLGLIILFALTVGTIVIFSGSWRLSFGVVGGIAAALVILSVSAFAVRYLSAKIGGWRRLSGRTTLRSAFAGLGHSREAASSIIPSIGLGLAVIAAIAQINGNTQRSIQGNLPDIAPSYFFVDIQTHQLPGFNERLNNDPLVERVESAPMLRGIITQINGKPAADTAGDHWVLQGDRGITYAATPPTGTKITDGAWWPEDYTGPTQISFAAEEAEEMGIALGDTMTINILGRDITGEITSFREVDFSNAGIGFILSVNPSALAGAPHSHIATVYAEPEAEAAILKDLATAFPNITAIRVRDAIDRAAAILNAISSGTMYGALATIITGFLVLISAAGTSAKGRAYEAAIMKTLGATRRDLFISFTIRSFIMGACAGLIALASGILAAWAVITFVFDARFAVIWPNAVFIILAGIILTTASSVLFLRGPLNARPAQDLRAKD